jgi:parallel beta-helix repeat protein
MSPFRPHGALLLAVLLLAAPLRAETLKVPQQFANIQAAVNVAVAGDVVQVSKGVYNENLNVTTSGIALHGKSGAVINGGYIGDCIHIVASDVEVSGFTLANGGVGQVLLTADLLPQTGGLYYKGPGAKLSKLVVNACESYGIYLDEASGSIEKCTVEGCPGLGIWVATGNQLATEVTTISKCEITRCGEGIEADNGPFLIEKNTADRCQSYGIHVVIPTLVADAPPTTTPTLITGNTCTDAFQYGMAVEIGAGITTVEKNTISHNGAGLGVSGFAEEILSNTFEDNDVFGAALSASDVHFAKNKLRGNGGGLFVGFGQIVSDGPSSVGNNHIEMNTIQDNTGDGIHVSSDANDIHDNVLLDNIGDGVQVASGFADNTLEGNAVSNNAHDGLDNWGTNTTIKDNKSKGNGGADLAGKGDGGGTTAGDSGNNTVGDGSGLSTLQELDLDQT